MSWNSEDAQCAGKQSHATKAGAMKVIGRIRKRGEGPTQHHKHKVRSTATLQPYRCARCHQWHLGNPSEGKPYK